MDQESTRRPTAEELTGYATKIGAFAAAAGLPETTGRIFGYLLVCEPEEQTEAQIADALDVSTAEAAAHLRMLAGMGLVQQVAAPDGVTETYRIDSTHLNDMVRHRMQLVTAFRRLADEGLALLGDDLGRGRRLREVRDLYAWLEQELVPLWEQRQARARAAAG